jgi:hypothetical protein
MLKSIEATIDVTGEVHLREPVQVEHPCRAIVTILDDPVIPETALLSEEILAWDWQKPEEDEAWSHLQ